MKKAVVLSLIILLLLSIPLQAQIDAERQKLGLSVSPAPAQAARSLWRFLGGVRSIAAAYLWIKIDEIHHAYYGDIHREQELIPLYRLVTWLDPQWEDAYFVGSYLLYIYKRPKESLAFAEEGVKMNPRSAKLYYSLGQIQFLQKKYEDAEKSLTKAVECSKNPTERAACLLLLTQVYRKMGDHEKAQKVWEEYLEVRAQLPEEERGKGFLQETPHH